LQGISKFRVIQNIKLIKTSRGANISAFSELRIFFVKISHIRV
jgi:hypothetical protein